MACRRFTLGMRQNSAVPFILQTANKKKKIPAKIVTATSV
jgi:hypothetical protein